MTSVAGTTACSRRVDWTTFHFRIGQKSRAIQYLGHVRFHKLCPTHHTLSHQFHERVGARLHTEVENKDLIQRVLWCHWCNHLLYMLV